MGHMNPQDFRITLGTIEYVCVGAYIIHGIIL